MIDLLVVEGGGTSQQLNVSTTSVQSAPIASPRVFVFSEVPCFMRHGSSPTAVADGTDQYLPGGTPVRLALPSGNRLAFISTGGTGKVYLTPIPRSSGF